MRTGAQNKAITSVSTKGGGGKCERCGRQRGPQSCRTVEGPVAGEYCVQWGLEPDPVRGYIKPTPDPVLRHERGAIDKWADAIADATKKMQDWDQELAKAKAKWLAAVHAQQTQPQPQTVWRRGGGEPVSVGLTRADIERLAVAERDAREELNTVESGWQLQRKMLSDIEHRAEYDRTYARLEDRGQRPIVNDE
ncbi:hypothetical protein ACH5AO_11265 [Streptomyces sp. NPDC018964]|uniref:hypothetical protein n=1 Tax=Streptomyces sp. NPDC018964 TaxID=3365058 RepID=UPI0037BB6D02